MLHLDAKAGYLKPCSQLSDLKSGAGQVIGIADMAEDMTERRLLEMQRRPGAKDGGDRPVGRRGGP
jgi:hypothetical protein